MLEAWYKHTFELSGDSSLGVTGGIIDSTGYVDNNEFANDQDSQFMNEAFVNKTAPSASSQSLRELQREAGFDGFGECRSCRHLQRPGADCYRCGLTGETL